MEFPSPERVRPRLEEARSPLDGSPTREAVVARAREALESLAEQAAELEAAVPARLADAVRESMRNEVLPVGRHVAELRGLANQTIRRLERLELESEAERRARAEDLNVLVDLVVEAWRALDRRLDRLEGTVQRLERSLVQAPAAELHGLHARRSSA